MSYEYERTGGERITMTIVAGFLLVLALAGMFRLRPHVVPASLSFFYWFPSWLTQSLALPLFILTFALGVWQGLDGQFSVTLAVIAIAAIVFMLVHLRNRRDGQRMLDAVGSKIRVPLLAGLWPAINARGTKVISDLSYGEHGKRNLLDIIAPTDLPSSPAPVLLHIHGGAWIMGKKNEQAQPLMRHLARNGWLCIDINYRLGPTNRFPAMITDVLKAIAWTREHIAEYGGDPSRIYLSGGSAGGHLTALAALVHDDPSLKPGFEDADCSVSGAVPLYGRYDFADRQENWGRNRDPLIRWKAEKIMPAALEEDPAMWDKASPLAQIRSDAPPMWVVHGRHDALLHVEDAEQFANALRGKGAQVTYTALSGGQHAYEIRPSALTYGHVRAIEHWLGQQRS